MSIIDEIEKWFKGPKDEKVKKVLPMPKAGQESYDSQAVPVATQQQEIPTTLNPIPVEVNGITPVWNLPNKHVQIKASGAYGTQPEILINGTYKLRRLTLWTPMAGMFIGREQDIKRPNGATATAYGDAVALPVNVPIILDGLDFDLWFVQTTQSVISNGDGQIYMIAEYWID